MRHFNGGIGADVDFVVLDKNKGCQVLGIESQFSQ